MQAQSLSVKRAEVEFHNFASLGEPERAKAHYAEENARRASLIRNHLPFIGELSPFLEIGANAGHTSYMLANEFGADGFALDISADALRYGVALQEQWNLSKGFVRVAGDAANLPFADGSLRFVMAFQMLSQFMNIESVFLEVKRVLAPGGVFFLSEEPLKRKLTMGLYRCPYPDTMKPWERRLNDWGLLGYLVRDVIGAHQEESFGIRQNHTMRLPDWQRLIEKHFAAHEYEMFVPERGWGERIVKRVARATDPYRPARWLGGTLSAFCRKGGSSQATALDREHFERYLRCPDCQGPVVRDDGDTLTCPQCHYQAANEGHVYNLLPSAERKELYPGDREDVIDFSLPGHESKLLEGFYELEGVFGNKFRWIGKHAAAQLKSVHGGLERLRVRGHAHERAFASGAPVEVTLSANRQKLRTFPLERPGLFILEEDLPEAAEYRIDVDAAPEWQAPPDDRTFTVNLSMIRLVPRD